LEQVVPLIEQLKIMRAREGEALEAILRGTLDRLATATASVAELRPEIEERYQERLTQRLAAVAGPEFNQQRVLEEVQSSSSAATSAKSWRACPHTSSTFANCSAPAAKPARNSTSCSRR